ncbi:MAG: EthD family reductase [Candidatus Dormiibacterota bacterium]
MVKVTVLYGEPTDSAAFEKYYLETHVPEHGAKIPGLVKVEINKGVSSPDAPAPYYRTADLYFNDMAGLQAGLGSAIGQAAVADLQKFATGGFKVLITEVEPVKLAAPAHAG